MDATLDATEFIDYHDPAVGAFVNAATAGVDPGDARATAVALFEAVRDGIRYDPYNTSHEPEAFLASTVAASNANWCVPKSVLLVAGARRCGIPARLGFADVRNHLTSEKLTEQMGTDVFYWHGYAEMLIDDRWLKASSAFNIELCRRFGVKALEFDGRDHALMHPFDEAGNRHMEYVNERGSFDDLPLDQILADFARYYPTMPMGDAGTPDQAFS